MDLQDCYQKWLEHIRLENSFVFMGMDKSVVRASCKNFIYTFSGRETCLQHPFLAKGFEDQACMLLHSCANGPQ